jgi:cyclase
VMLAKRVIPTMLVRGRTLVKGIAFDAWRSIGHAAQAARVHARRGVDELLILDISATAEGRGPDLDLVRELSADCFIPITVGGGVRTCEDIDAAARGGGQGGDRHGAAHRPGILISCGASGSGRRPSCR